ncbi:hypothetical protein GCM10010363_74700 [Streptomyces omiyaensis]|nr:hypothetical protein GCM10010363_74700 [Streptomyces omiyaensis]
MAGKAEAHKTTVPVRARKLEERKRGCMGSSLPARNEKFHLVFREETISRTYPWGADAAVRTAGEGRTGTTRGRA